MTDFGKKAAADLARVAREIRQSTTSSMRREDGGHFSFSIPERVIPPAPRTPPDRNSGDE